MKKLLTGLFLFAAIASQAQTNLQVHYDLGKNRNYVTTTLEMFKPDKWGNTFFFVDYNYNYGEDKSPSETYFEIARCINVWGGPLSAQIEYNGGLGGGPINNVLSYSYPINNCWLGGVDYFMHSADFSKTLNLKLLYKQIMGKQASAQFTTVWGIQMLNKKVSFTGFADIWLEDNTNSNGSQTSTVFITEPQLWYNFSENLSAGTEVEIASNFAGKEGFQVNPTIGVKWNF